MTQINAEPQLALLRWMLEDVRKVTLGGVSHLTKKQLFTPPIEGEYPIGAYLMHLCEVDLGWLEVISGEEQPEEIKERSYYSRWFDCGPDYHPPKDAIDVSEYLEVLEITRKKFLDYISSLKDSELEDIITRKVINGERKYSKKWIIYHIIEHEAHTRGQIFMLIRKARWNKK
ncbi:MAG TPA: DinB family protein [Ignavibacteria bacterium]